MLWAARPAIVVSDDGDELVHWCRAGGVGCFATSRFFPGRDQLPRAERQLVSLESRRWHYRGVPARGTSLTFIRARAWASVAATWYPDGQFAHWYVNFQLPMQRWARGYDTLDLVIDIVVAPDWSWAWKDADPFRTAIQRGIFDPAVEREVKSEAERVEEAIAARSGPFSAKWMGWTAPDHWPSPQLPADFADGAATPPGATITLSSHPVA
jgi:protein associated with RNAse G/E